MKNGTSCCGPECCDGTGEALKAGTAVKEVKEAVKEKYAAIAEGSAGEGCGCGPRAGDGLACCDTVSVSEDYRGVAGHVAEADLGLGCGFPLGDAELKEGETVVDLGSGAGNDAFVARAQVGESGRVIGVDMTEAMVHKAKRNAERLGHGNVEFRLGDIEDLPLRDNLADVVISNCVLNLAPDKARAFAEAFRVLKPGGRLAVSDIVVSGEMPGSLRADVELYVGCVAGAMPKAEYLGALGAAGFSGARFAREREITVPADLVESRLGAEGAKALAAGGFKVLSVTVRAEKPR